MTISFAVIADTHFAEPGARQDGEWWNKMLFSHSVEIAKALVTTLNSLSPDFVIHCGDFTDDSDEENFHFGKGVMDQLSCPYFITLGNHDTWNEGVRDAVAPVFGLTSGRFHYARTLGGLRFIFLDCASWMSKDGKAWEHLDWNLYREGGYLGIGPTEEELQWLRRELDNSGNKPVFIVTHMPIHAKPIRPPSGFRPPSPKYHFNEYCVYNDQLYSIITHYGNVKAVFAGDWHFHDITYHEGILHCTTASLIEFPFELRYVQIRNDRMSITTLGLCEDNLREASLVEEWGNQWVVGWEKDREYSISLT